MPVVPDVRRSVDRSPEPDLLGASRRVDWRFLLPTGDRPLGRLRLVGGDAGIAGQIVDVGLARTVVTDAEDRSPVDAVVSLGGDPGDLLPLLSGLRPGGVLYCEVDRGAPGTLRWSPARLSRRLREAGMTTAAYWRRRRAGHDNLFLPLDAPGAVPWYLREVMDARGPVRRVARGTLRLLVRRNGHRLGLVARRYSVVAVAGSPDSHAGELPAPGLLGPGARDMLPAMLAGGEGAWSRVVLLPFAGTGRRPRTVLKLPRTREHNPATEREQRTLRRVRSAVPPDLAAGLPSVLGTRTWAGLCVGSESFVAGRPVASAPRRTAETSTLDAAVAWLIRLDLATARALAPPDRPGARRVLDESFRQTVGTLRLPFDADAVCGRFGAERAGDTPIPVVWQHCDLTPFNLRWDGSRHALVDWESARPGPALCDLLYLLLHWQWTGLPSFGAAPAEVFDAVFLSGHGVPASKASAQVRRYCAALGVDGALVGPLLLRMLSQQALDRAERVRDVGLDPADDTNVYADLFGRLVGHPDAVPAWGHP
jgi:aminoglycoside phosphotransferase (APT) family kinase protein